MRRHWAIGLLASNLGRSDPTITWAPFLKNEHVDQWHQVSLLLPSMWRLQLSMRPLFFTPCRDFAHRFPLAFTVIEMLKASVGSELGHSESAMHSSLPLASPWRT